MNLKNLVTPVREVPSTWKRRLLIVFWGLVVPPLFVLMALFFWIKSLGDATKENAFEIWYSIKMMVKWYRDDLVAMWTKDYTPGIAL